jgi:hypothetical protein
VTDLFVRVSEMAAIAGGYEYIKKTNGQSLLAILFVVPIFVVST